VDVALKCIQAVLIYSISRDRVQDSSGTWEKLFSSIKQNTTYPCQIQARQTIYATVWILYYYLYCFKFIQHLHTVFVSHAHIWYRIIE